MKKLFYFISLLLLNQSTLYAQSNIVLNPSLENHYDTAEIGVASFRDNVVTNWSDPNDGSSDYFLPNSLGAMATPPCQFNGFEYPHSGYCYGGFIILELPSHAPYEYVEASFLSPMQAGQTYAIESFVSLAEYSVCMSNLGFYFSDTAVYYRASGARIPLTPQFTNPDSNMITTHTGWQRITGSYTAHGGEKYMSIGNFLPYGLSNVDTCISVVDSNFYAAYLLIDDVAVYDTSKVDTINLCMNDSVEIGGLWRENEGLYTDIIGGLPVKFYVHQRPNSANLTILSKPFIAGDSVKIVLLQSGGPDTSYVILGLHNFVYVKSDTIIDIPMYNIYGCDSTVRYICGTHIGIPDMALSNEFWSVYPNPANDFIQIKLSANDPDKYLVKIMDIAGRSLLSQALDNPQIEITNLKSGIYFVSLYNAKTGKLVGNKKFVKE